MITSQRIAKCLIHLLIPCLLSACAGAKFVTTSDYNVPLSFAVDGELPLALAKGEFSFSSYNVHQLDDAVEIGRDMQRLEWVDVWALQEVFQTARAGSDGLFRVRGPNFAFLPPGLWYGVYAPANVAEYRGEYYFECQVIVSRWPITRSEIWDLDRSGEKRRVALVAWIDWNGTTIACINVDNEVSLLGLGPRDREKQISSLLDRVSTLGSVPTVVAGDFNTAGKPPLKWFSRREITNLYGAMDEAGFEGVCYDTQRTADTFSAFGVYSRRLDHMFFRNLVYEECGVFEGAEGSDHRPIWGSFFLE